jgi:hypothetical protein
LPEELMQKEQREKIYFGHPINLYNTPIETDLIRKIQERFLNCDVISPHLNIHKEGYQRYKLEKGNGMLYFETEVLPQMDAGIFLPFEDGKFGAGVFKEMNFLRGRTKPIFGINLEGLIWVVDIKLAEALTVEETRKRVYG